MGEVFSQTQVKNTSFVILLYYGDWAFTKCFREQIKNEKRCENHTDLIFSSACDFRVVGLVGTLQLFQTIQCREQWRIHDFGQGAVSLDPSRALEPKFAQNWFFFP